MNLTNLQRDQFHANLANDDIPLSTPKTISSTILGNHSNNVQSAESARHCNDNPTVASGSWVSFGNIMEGNRGSTEREAYRIKAHAIGVKEMWVVIGTLPASPTGTDDLVSKVQAFPMGNGSLDEVIRLKIASGDVGLPMYFGIAFGEATGDLCSGAISVQRMAIAAPTYASSMS